MPRRVAARQPRARRGARRSLARPSSQEVLEVLAGVGGGDLRDGLGRPLGHELPAGVSALGPEVQDPVGALDHVEVVLDHEHGVAGVDQALEHAEEPPHVVEMEPGGGLVEDVEDVVAQPGAQLRGDLEALGLAARERGGGLAEAEVAEAHVLEHLEPARQPRRGGEERDGLVDRHLEHLADVAPLVGDLPDVRAVAAPLALAARHVDVLEEVHLELLEAVALAGLAAPAGDVEREVARPEPEGLGLRQAREQPPDVVERLDVRDRVRPRRPADRLLVDEPDPAQVLEPQERVVGARRLEGGLERARHRPVERVVDQRRLPRAGDAGDAGERAERDARP